VVAVKLPLLPCTVTDKFETQPFASVTWMLYVPAARLLHVLAPATFVAVCKTLFARSVQVKSYGPIPPCGVAVAVPLLWLHDAGVLPISTCKAVGWVIVTVAYVTHNVF